MKKILEQLGAEMGRITLTSKEKSHMRGVIFSSIALKSIRNAEGARHALEKRGLYVLWLEWFSITPLLKPASLALLLTLFLGGGVAFGAEGSVPGNILYPVKVRVNEVVRGWLAVSPGAKAEWDARLANRRLEEAETLAAEGTLDTETKTKLEENFKVYADRVKGHAAAFEGKNNLKDASDIVSNLEVSIEAHKKILMRLNEKEKGNKEGIGALVATLDKENKTVSKNRAELDLKIVAEDRGAGVRSAAEGRRKAAQNKIAEVRRYIEDKKEDFGTEAVAEAEDQVRVAEETVREGDTKFTAGEFGEAFVLFGKAHRIVEEAKLFIRANKEFRINTEQLPLLNIGDHPNTSASAETGAGNVFGEKRRSR